MTFNEWWNNTESDRQKFNNILVGDDDDDDSSCHFVNTQMKLEKEEWNNGIENKIARKNVKSSMDLR